MFLIPNISFGQVDQTKIDNIQRQIQSILVQIRELQKLLNELQMTQNLDVFTIPKEEIKPQEVSPQQPEQPQPPKKENQEMPYGRNLPIVEA